MSKMFSYEADQIHDMVHPNLLTDTTHYVAECKDIILNEVTPNYPKLTEYEKEWMYFAENVYQDGHPVNLEYQLVDIVGEGSVENAIPFYYKSAILKGNTGYRDIDTGEFLETFEEGRNLELVSVKMPVLTTTGKNLFDIEKLEGLNVNIEMIPNGIRIKNSQFDITRCFATPFKENTQYTASFKHTQIEGEGREGFRIYYTDGTESYIIPASNSSWVGSTLPNKTIKSVSLSFNNKGTSELTYIQLEEGTVATSYEPYKSNILTVNEEVELRGIGDVTDELDLLTGELTERIGECVLDGNNEIYLGSKTTDTFVEALIYMKDSDPKKNLNEHKGMTNNVAVITEHKDGINYFRLNTGSNDYFIYGILANQLEGVDVNGVKKYLQQKPVTVQYTLATESVKTVDLNGVIKPYEGTNHYTVSSEIIPPQLQLSVPVESTGAQTLNEINQEE